MPAQPSIAYATLCQTVPSVPYILSILPSPSGHLILRHPTPYLTLADPQTLQQVDTLQGGHTGNISDVVVDETAIWSGGKDGGVVRWDERGRRAAMSFKANVRKPVPVTALAASESDHLIIVGTEVVSSEAHILYYDTRNPKIPAYSHSSTHSDDITHLSLLPPTSSFVASSSSTPLPPRLLLSASTDGLIALSDMRESDEDEAVQAEENWGQSIATAGFYEGKIWGRSDMDAVSIWEIGKGEEGLELSNPVEFGTEEFKFRTYDLPATGPSITGPAGVKKEKVQSDYLVDVVPSLGISKSGAPMAITGTNDGDMIVKHHYTCTPSYQPSAFFLSGPDEKRGHKDVIRSLFHDVRSEAVYTGSEDGVLAGWSLAGMARLRIGNPEIDDDGGDGREDVGSDDEGDEESEIESEESGMDVDDDDEEMEDGPRNGPILGKGADRREKKKDKRHQPY